MRSGACRRRACSEELQQSWCRDTTVEWASASRVSKTGVTAPASFSCRAYACSINRRGSHAGSVVGKFTAVKSALTRATSADDRWPKFLRQLRRKHAACRHCLTVHPGPIAHLGLDGVTKGVARG